MASTLIIYQGTGSQTDYTIPFDYLKKSFVNVSLEGETLKGGDPGDTGADYYFIDKTTIRLKVAPPEGQFLTVRRYTSETQRVVTFKDASVLKANDLDTSQLQAFHIAAEARDIINDALIQDKFDNWDAKRHRIVNLADPVDHQDAVTYKVYKEDAQGAYQSRLGAQRAQAAAQAAQSASQTAQGKAQAAQGKAQAAQSASQLAQKASQTAQKASQAAQVATQSARDIALQAKSDTVAAKNETVTAKTQAQTARTQAQSAQAAAQSARDSALSSKTSAQSSATSAKNWAIKMDGPVEGSEYSAKYHATQAKTTVDGGVDAINSARDSAIQSVASQGKKQVGLVTSSGTTQVNLAKAQVAKATEQAGIATTKASQASQSASAASTSQANAKASQTNSKTSQTKAKASQTNAKASETSATGSASAAASSAQSAQASASAASDSASAASASATTAHDEAQRAKEYADQASTGQIQADWNQSDSSQKDYIKNKPTLSTVATTGNYSDLIGVPEIPDPTWQNIQNKPADYPPSAHTHVKSQITDFAHVHAISQITNLQTTLDGKLGKTQKAVAASTADSATTAGTANAVAWDNVSGKPRTFPPSAHNHSTSQITGIDDYVTKSELQEAIKSSAGLPMGHHYAWPFKTIPANSIQCNGATYDRTLYADFFAYATQQGWVKTESEWQSIASSNGGYCPWYSDGDGSTNFRTPKFAPFMQIAIASGNVGNYHEAGLPNIAGKTSHAWAENTDYGCTGPFYKLSDGVAGVGSQGSTANYRQGFDASLYNSLFGNSDTIQPESNEWMICVVVMGKATNIGSADVANVMSTIAQVQGSMVKSVNGIFPDNGNVVISMFHSYDLKSDIKYVRFDNGLQIIYAQQKQNTVTFPVAFIDANYTASVSFWSGANHGGYASEYCFTDKKTTSINVKGSSNGGLYRDLLCIGRWK